MTTKKTSLSFAQHELERILWEQQGMTFKYKKEQGRFIHTFCAGKLLNKIGLTSQEVVGRELKDFYPAQIAVRKELYYELAWQGEEDITYEGEINGIFYLASLRPIRQSDRVIEVIASCVDITERKRAEEELRSTKELLESLIHNSADGICVTDIQGNVIRVNRAFEELYGWSEKELTGSPLPIFPIHTDNDLEDICNHLRAGKQVINKETVRQRKNGDILHVCITVSPIKDAEGRVIALTGITRDITERKRTEEFLRKSDKLNVVGQLAAGLAHEIRNPLTSLRGFIQLIKSAAAEKYHDIMLSELDRINGIVSEFLIIAKPQTTSFRQNELKSMLTDVVTLLESQAIMYGIQIHLETEAFLPPIHCSEIQMKQVFVNILKNAIEAMPHGGDIHIAASVHNQNNVLIRFIDQGDGIPEHLLHRLGDPFYTTKEKGTGLGLMMCYKIVGAHEGYLSIGSTKNEGTTIDVVLPVLPGQDTTAAAPESE